MPAPTRVCVRRLTVALDRPVRSAISPLPSRSEPGRNERRISIPLSRDRLAGEATIAAALATAQSVGAEGLAFLRGVVLGYEVATRIGVAMGRAHYKYWHN